MRPFVNSFFSLNSQHILVNKILNDKQCGFTSYYEKNVWFFMKIQKFWAKRFFKSWILGKTPVWIFLWVAKRGSHFSVIFKFYIYVLILSKRSQDLWFSKIILTFWKYGVFVPLLNFFKNLHLLSDFHEVFCETSLFDCLLRIGRKL